MVKSMAAENKNVKTKTYKTYSFKLGVKYDAEILGKLETVKSKGGYIKDLIKKDIAGELNYTSNFKPDKAKELILQYNTVIKEKYGEKYLNNNEKAISFQCGFDTYPDVIEKLDSVENKSEYVKNLILIDMGLINADGERFMMLEVDGELRTKDRKSDEKKLEAQREYRKRTGSVADKEWNKKNIKKFSVLFNRQYDTQIIKKLESVKNKSGYIKELIKKDIENGQGE